MKTIALSNVHYTAKGEPSLAWLEEISCWFQNHSFQRSWVCDSDFHTKVVLERRLRYRRGYVKFFGITYYFLQVNHMSENLNLKMIQVTCTSSPSISALKSFHLPPRLSQLSWPVSSCLLISSPLCSLAYSHTTITIPNWDSKNKTLVSPSTLNLPLFILRISD